MKKIISIFLFTFFINTYLKSQNTYDPYIDFGFPSSLSFIPGIYGGSSFSGEYQLFIRSVGDGYNHWSVFANNDIGASTTKPYSLSYKIEVVSFPFAPSFVASSPFNRVLHSYSNADYNSITKLWDARAQREYKGVYAPLGGAAPNGLSINGPSTLVSAEFKDGYESTVPSRILYPHTILKHTIYIYCNVSATGTPVDSLQFIIDNTRGNMRHYPFYAVDPATGISPAQHDILIASTLYLPSAFNESTNEVYDWNPYFSASVPASTIDYFPYPFGVANCPGYFPAPATFLFGSPDPQNYIHPPSYSLSGYQVLNGIGDNPAGYGYGTSIIPTGIKHNYVVDQPIDLTIINPSKKVIYNPSETSIDLNTAVNTTGIHTLTFPSGYVFKTVMGVYPTATQVYNADPDQMYSDPRQIPVPTTLSYNDPSTATVDERKSYYYIKNGSTLKIEACVGIYDAQIVVENGGTLVYDPLQTYGNFTIQQLAGGNVSALSLMPAINCAHDCYDLSKYDYKDLTISSNTTWTSSSSPDVMLDGVIRFAGTLRIAAGKTLTIGDGMYFEFGENGEIIVERGAKLIVNGLSTNTTTFTSTTICKKSMWKGISVWGTRTLQQGGAVGAAAQGAVTLNYVSISNAKNAIATRNGADGWNYNGGIIRCTHVEFKNNRRAVEFLSYHHITSAGSEIKNLSFFKNCQFLMTDYLLEPSYEKGDGRRFAVAEVTLWDVKDVRFESCLFANTATKTDGSPLFDSDLRGAGIYAIDAGVQLYAGPAFSNEFDGWSDAVWLLSTVEKDYISIVGNVFKNNVHGITLEATDLSVIHLNTFEIPAHENNPAIASSISLEKGYNKPTGLYLIGATNFNAQENTFTNFGPSTTSGELPQAYNYGMVVNNSSGSMALGSFDGAGIGYVYKNSFNNMNVNLQTELDNIGDLSTGASGLEYSCNNFNTRVNLDVTVADGPGGTYSLLKNQGLCLSALTQAGNGYTSCIATSDVQLSFSTGGSILYNAGFLYSDQPGIYTCTNLTSSITPCLGVGGINSCPSNFSLCGSLPCLTTYYGDALLAAKQNASNYGLLIDGGNTTLILSKINSTMAAGTLKTALLNASPYLSDVALIAMLNKTSPLPAGHIKQIILANSPITAPVMTLLQTKGLPAGIVSSIVDAQTGTSARSLRANELNYYKFKAKLAEVNLKQGYFAIDNIDSIKILAEKDSSLVGLFTQIELLISRGEYAAAQLCMNKLHPLEGGIHTDKCKMDGIRLNLAQLNKSWFDMTQSQYTTIQQIYAAHPETAIEARSILALTKGLQYQRYPFDVSAARSMVPMVPEAVEPSPSVSSFSVYPNPSNNDAHVVFQLTDETVPAELLVYNALGSRVLKRAVVNKEILTIATHALSNGIYLFVLKTNNNIVQQKKVMIVHE
jgi:Secretion system C-terminal sorting domain